MANKFWASEIATQHIPVPERYYTSPLDRCLATANITFHGLQLPAHQPCIPEVKELLREVIGIHTCDRRSNRTYIHTNFPAYTFEPGFAEDDDMWSPDVRESHDVHDVRVSRNYVSSFGKYLALERCLGRFHCLDMLQGSMHLLI